MNDLTKKYIIEKRMEYNNEQLLLMRKVLNNNGYYFYRDIEKMWSTKFTSEELEILKKSLGR